MNQILFLCTGNYYRSRFAEQYFNFKAKELHLNWLATSKGLLRDLSFAQNVGPISEFTVNYLMALNINVDSSRMPVRVEYEDFTSVDRVVALSRDEHVPMMEKHFKPFVNKIDYFEIEDVHLESHETALPKLKKTLDQYILNIHQSI